jgi:hypothetical protein
VREPLGEIPVRVEGDPSAIPGERLRADVEGIVRDHDTWTQVVTPEDFDRLWRGIQWA